MPQLSREVFAGEAVIVEAMVATRTFKKVKEHLEQLDGVNTVTREQELFRISCTRDITAEISKEIISAGAGITWLKRQEYGLDDIYHRYFEGGTENVRSEEHTSELQSLMRIPIAVLCLKKKTHNYK